MRRADACRSLLAEALLRYAFIEGTGTEIDVTGLRIGEFGKPWLPESTRQFNLSHSGDWVVCALDSEEIGIDVERHHTVQASIPERFFTAAEKAWLGNCLHTDPGQKRFFDLWALKESYIKAIGLGLSCPLDTFSCIPEDGSAAVRLELLDPALPARHLRLLPLEDGYSLAVCTLSPGTGIELLRLAPKALVETAGRRCRPPEIASPAATPPW